MPNKGLLLFKEGTAKMKLGFVAILCIPSLSAFTPNPRKTSLSGLSMLPEAVVTTVVTQTGGPVPDFGTTTELANVGVLAGLSATPMSGIAAAVGVALAGAGALAFSKSTSAPSKTQDVAESEPDPIDVSIPYDAAATLSYLEVKGVEEIEDHKEFEKFKAFYEAFTVGEVSLKKASREYEAFKATIA